MSLNENPNRLKILKLLEEKVFELAGTKTLISKNHYSREKFWEIYNEKKISSLKEELDPKNLLGNLYEKFSPNNYGKEA